MTERTTAVLVGLAAVAWTAGFFWLGWAWSASVTMLVDAGRCTEEIAKVRHDYRVDHCTDTPGWYWDTKEDRCLKQRER